MGMPAHARMVTIEVHYRFILGCVLGHTCTPGGEVHTNGSEEEASIPDDVDLCSHKPSQMARCRKLACNATRALGGAARFSTCNNRPFVPWGGPSCSAVGGEHK